MESNLCDLYIVKQTSRASIGSDPLTKVRFTSESLKGNRTREASNEIIAGGQVSDLFELSANQTGGFNGELSLCSAPGTSSADTLLFDLIAGLLFSSGWIAAASAISSLTDLVFADSGDDTTITTSAGDFSTLTAGQYIMISGCTDYAANNRWVRIKSINETDDVLTVTPQLSAGSETGSVTITPSYFIYNSSPAVNTYFAAERYHDLQSPTADAYFQYKNMCPENWQLEIAANSIITHNFSFIGGEEVGPYESASSLVTSNGTQSANTNTPVNATSNVGTILEGGSAASGIYIQSIDLTVSRTPRAISEVSALWPSMVLTGGMNVSGSLNALFTKTDLYDKYVANTSSQLVIPLTDPQGNTLIITIERVKFIDAEGVNVGGKDQEVPLNLSFTGLKGQTFERTIQFDFFPA